MRRHLAYAAAGAAVLALAGCGDDPEPRIADPTSTPSSSSSPSESAAAEKEPWEEKTDDGAVAFVEHWLEVFSTAFQTGETQDLQALHAKTCPTCDGFVGLIEDAWSDGGEIRGDAWSASSLAPSKNPPDGKAAISATIDQPGQVIVDANGGEERTPPGTVEYLFELAWAQGQWRVASFAIVEAKDS